MSTEKRSGTAFVGGLAGKTPHLYFVLAEPDEQGNLAEPDEQGNVVIVNVTTHAAGKDATVILQSGDHPFVRHPSSVYYASAKTAPWPSIRKGLDEGLIVQKESLGDALLDRIRRGGLDSPFTPRKIKAALRQALGL
jgi:hypothetical protein